MSKKIFERFGYTLAEVLVSLAIIGVIAAIAIPMIMNVIPNKNAIMIKKAYYTVDNIVKLLINDSYYYPDMKGNCWKNDCSSDGKLMAITNTNRSNNCYLGFDYVENLPLTIKSSGGTISDSDSDKRFKLIYLFISYLDTVKPLSYYLGNTSDTAFEFVETTDGMVFNLLGLKNFYNTNNNIIESSNYCSIKIDVNGKEGPNSYAPTYNNKEPKCSSYSNWSAATTANNFEKKRFDRFELYVYKDGRIEIADEQTDVVNIVNSDDKDYIK